VDKFNNRFALYKSSYISGYFSDVTLHRRFPLHSYFLGDPVEVASSAYAWGIDPCNDLGKSRNLYYN
jgi:hypothetical protein